MKPGTNDSLEKLFSPNDNPINRERAERLRQIYLWLQADPDLRPLLTYMLHLYFPDQEKSQDRFKNRLILIAFIAALMAAALAGMLPTIISHLHP